jgi:hypothetical protein
MDKLEYGAHPAPESMPELKGIFVGGCVERGIGSSFRATAHAHDRENDSHHGWVCVRSARKVYANGKPTRVLWHEYAHILAGHAAGHGAKWQRVMRLLGQPLNRKRPSKLIGRTAA